MNRRGFLGFFGGAVASGSTAAKAIIGETALKQAGFAAGSELVGAAPMVMEPASPGAIAKISRWIKRQGIPAWKMYDLRRQADYERQNGLDADLAVLVSVSAGWKARAQRKRNLDRVIERSIAGIGRNSARNRFEDRMRKQFGIDPEWYD